MILLSYTIFMLYFRIVNNEEIFYCVKNDFYFITTQIAHPLVIVTSLINIFYLFNPKNWNAKFVFLLFNVFSSTFGIIQLLHIFRFNIYENCPEKVLAFNYFLSIYFLFFVGIISCCFTLILLISLFKILNDLILIIKDLIDIAQMHLEKIHFFLTLSWSVSLTVLTRDEWEKNNISLYLLMIQVVFCYILLIIKTFYFYRDYTENQLFFYGNLLISLLGIVVILVQWFLEKINNLGIISVVPFGAILIYGLYNILPNLILFFNKFPPQILLTLKFLTNYIAVLEIIM